MAGDRRLQETLRTDAPLPPTTSLKYALLTALLVAVVSGSLLWLLRPRAPSHRIVPLLIQVTSPTSGPQLSVLNGNTQGQYQIHLFGGPGDPSDRGTELGYFDIRWHTSGSLRDLSLQTVLDRGSWQVSSGGVSLGTPAERRLPPGHYVIEITGSEPDGSLCAGAQQFGIGRSNQ